MKSSELNKIMKKLILSERFEKKGRLAYYTLTHKTGSIILAGFYLDNSVDSNSFFVNYFIQCLYVPFNTYDFSLGGRIGSYWDTNNISELQDRINEFDLFSKLSSFDEFLQILNKHPYYGDKTGRDVYFALTYYILDEYSKALHFLNKIILLKNKDDSCLYSQEIANAQLMKDYIVNGFYDKGISQILLWQKQTITKIGLNIK